jgi:signal transduction histidine kinase
VSPHPVDPAPPERPAGRSLRRRIRTGIVGVTALAMLLFAVPLAVAVSRLYRGNELAELERDATRIAALVPDNPIGPTAQVKLPASALDDRTATVGLYRPNGARVAGIGPVRSSIARASANGRVHQGTEGGELTVSVPVPSDFAVVGVVRASVATRVVSTRAYRAWAGMALLALAVLAVAAGLARLQARRIAAPLERLTKAARALGDGNFAVTTEHSGIQEADAAGLALRDTAARLGRLLERERAFSADASHQLRTPLTGLLLSLESALARPGADLRSAADEAVARGHALQDTIEDLLSLRRDVQGGGGSCDVSAELSAAEERWSPQFTAASRRVTVSVSPELPPVAASAAALRQILDVLVDNALHHGGGTVSLSGHEAVGAVSVEVADEGPGLGGDPEEAFVRRSPTARGRGIGLALARSLAEADGGRMLLRRAAPHPVFAVLLPVADAVFADSLSTDQPVNDPPHSGTRDREGS